MGRRIRTPPGTCSRGVLRAECRGFRRGGFPSASEKRVPLHARALAFSVKICASFGRLLRGSLRLTRSLRKKASFFMVVSFASNTFARPRACLTLCLILPALESAIRRTSFSLPHPAGDGAPKAPTSALGGQKGRGTGESDLKVDSPFSLPFFSREQAPGGCVLRTRKGTAVLRNVLGTDIPRCTAGSGLFAA